MTYDINEIVAAIEADFQDREAGQPGTNIQKHFPDITFKQYAAALDVWIEETEARALVEYHRATCRGSE